MLNKLIFKYILFFILLCKVTYANDTLFLNKESNISYLSETVLLKDYELLIDEWSFEGFMIIESKNLKFDSLIIYFCKSLNDFNNQEKFYYNLVGIHERSISNSEFKSGKITELNSLIFYYQLFSKYRNLDKDVYINIIKNVQLKKWIDLKTIYRMNNKNYLIFRVFFDTAFLKNKNDQKIILFPLSKLYEFEYINKDSAEISGFENTNIIIKLID
ncbi:MAG: hypothetical protein IAE65_02495 [Ignavibacteria bacterium]|nr:hypothetical protein [Ignavibacteria bacterium]